MGLFKTIGRIISGAARAVGGFLGLGRGGLLGGGVVGGALAGGLAGGLQGGQNKLVAIPNPYGQTFLDIFRKDYLPLLAHTTVQLNQIANKTFPAIAQEIRPQAFQDTFFSMSLFNPAIANAINLYNQQVDKDRTGLALTGFTNTPLLQSVVQENLSKIVSPLLTAQAQTGASVYESLMSKYTDEAIDWYKTKSSLLSMPAQLFTTGLSALPSNAFYMGVGTEQAPFRWDWKGGLLGAILGGLGSSKLRLV